MLQVEILLCTVMYGHYVGAVPQGFFTTRLRGDGQMFSEDFFKGIILVQYWAVDIFYRTKTEMSTSKWCNAFSLHYLHHAMYMLYIVLFPGATQFL